ncbi:hypothetical protein PoB_000178900 [Plakobranchus ocellatus]|uniref:Uncharacterized protein n=1 Tax=Plakobranchus ocellatus TaxID=259542 RepID=A0AAV3XWP9_9GAST|nr:hypothetical protein PoB_000178900 [Plakobranchus ocellatus]
MTEPEERTPDSSELREMDKDNATKSEEAVAKYEPTSQDTDDAIESKVFIQGEVGQHLAQSEMVATEDEVISPQPVCEDRPASDSQKAATEDNNVPQIASLTETSAQNGTNEDNDIPKDTSLTQTNTQKGTDEVSDELHDMKHVPQETALIHEFVQKEINEDNDVHQETSLTQKGATNNEPVTQISLVKFRDIDQVETVTYEVNDEISEEKKATVLQDVAYDRDNYLQKKGDVKTKVPENKVKDNTTMSQDIDETMFARPDSKAITNVGKKRSDQMTKDDKTTFKSEAKTASFSEPEDNRDELSVTLSVERLDGTRSSFRALNTSFVRPPKSTPTTSINMGPFQTPQTMTSATEVFHANVAHYINFVIESAVMSLTAKDFHLKRSTHLFNVERVDNSFSQDHFPDSCGTKQAATDDRKGTGEGQVTESTSLRLNILHRPANFQANSTQLTYVAYPPLSQLPYYPKLALPRKWGVPLTPAEPRTVLVGFTCPPAPKFRQDQLMTHSASTLRRYYSKPCIKAVEWIKVSPSGKR